MKGVIFPRFPQMLEDWRSLGKPPIFTYNIMGGRKMSIVADPNLFKVIFFPDQENLSSNQEVLAHHWFGIEKDLSAKYTGPGLANTRKALKHAKAKNMNDIVADGIMEQFEDFGSSGTSELMDFAWLTFWPVNKAMFGDAISPSVCPHIRQDLETYNEGFELVANGMPRKMFPEMEAAAVKMAHHFGEMIGQGLAEKESCPVLKARVDAIDKDDTRWSNDDKGRFVMSVFWAAQANTVPGTFWALAMALADSEIKAKCIAEARAPAFAQQPDAEGKYDVKALPYTNALVKEVLRLKVANITHRKSQTDFCLMTKSGKAYKMNKGEGMTVCSYLQHHDEEVFADPYAFRPDRWLDGTKYPFNAWFPFGGGPNTCSGKFLAMQEIATLVALFFREFDAELVDPVPAEEWDNVVAMVTPKQPYNCRIKYSRVAT